MTPQRELARQRLEQETFDVIVIGGGATGAGIARDAVLRGLRVALLEKDDFAAGTSSRSSKLIHGGLRYLQHLQIKLVFEGVRERTLLCRLAPHLVRPLPFLYPTFRGRFPTLSILDAGLWLYDGLSRFRMGRHRRYNARGVHEIEPLMTQERLTGGIVYEDAVTDDARLTLETLLEAHDLGACVLNHAQVTGLERRGGRVVGVEAEDRLSGAIFSVRGRVTVNAAGPWSDHLLRSLGETRPRRLRPTKGAHIIVDRARLPVSHAVVIMAPAKRIAFAIPWEYRTVIGTTDTDYDGDLDRVVASGEDVDYLLGLANSQFPEAALSRADILATWAGLRPLVAADAVTESEVSREHEIFTEGDGIISIVGGKLTTYRRMAREVVDEALERLRRDGFGDTVADCTTGVRPLRGAAGLDESHTLETLMAQLESEHHLPGAVAHNLVLTYGTRAPEVLAPLAQDRSLGERIDPELPYIWAQVRYAVETELAETLDDLLSRRVPLAIMARDQGLGPAPEIARRMGELLGWSDDQRAHALADYQQVVAGSRAYGTP